MKELDLPLPACLLLILMGVVAPVFGIWAGLWRVGWTIPVPDTHFPGAHGPLMVSGFMYDGLLHALFVGFVFSMIFGHAPVIFPAVLKVQAAFRPSFYVHLVLLHFSLALRMVADFMSNVPLRQWGSLLNGIAILLFLYNTVTSILDTKYSYRS